MNNSEYEIWKYVAGSLDLIQFLHLDLVQFLHLYDSKKLRTKMFRINNSSQSEELHYQKLKLKSTEKLSKN